MTLSKQRAADLRGQCAAVFVAYKSGLIDDAFMRKAQREFIDAGAVQIWNSRARVASLTAWLIEATY